jgi:hypothetical protein
MIKLIYESLPHSPEASRQNAAVPDQAVEKAGTFLIEAFNAAKSDIIRSNVMLRRWIYISRSLIGADPKGIDAIVSSSVKRNAAAEVTGMLWADGRNFAQVLEGSSDQVQLTMERIRTDHRHTDIVELLDRPVLSRQFGSWAMRRAGDDEASAHGTTFMIGFAMGERTKPAERLYEIIVASDGLRLNYVA